MGIRGSCPGGLEDKVKETSGRRKWVLEVEPSSTS